MSNKTMLENKQIIVGDNEYRLTIFKGLNISNSHPTVYKAHLSDVNSQFTASRKFSNLQELEVGLQEWIARSDSLNNPEVRVFEHIRQWDGVVR